MNRTVRRVLVLGVAAGGVWFARRTMAERSQRAARRQAWMTVGTTPAALPAAPLLTDADALRGTAPPQAVAVGTTAVDATIAAVVTDDPADLTAGDAALVAEVVAVADAQPADAQPADAQPADAQPADAEPVDAQPVDAQVDAQPADAQPADAQPVSAEPGTPSRSEAVSPLEVASTLSPPAEPAPGEPHTEVEALTAPAAAPAPAPAPAEPPPTAPLDQVRERLAALNVDGPARSSVAAERKTPVRSRRTRRDPRWIHPDDAGACADTHPIKVKLRSGLFHLPGMLVYDRTRADRCYRSAEDAVADGFERAKR